MSDPNDPYAGFPDWARPKAKLDPSDASIGLATPDPPPKVKKAGGGKRAFVPKEKAPDPNAPQPKGEVPKEHLEFWSYAFSDDGDYNFTHDKDFGEAIKEAVRLLALAPDEGESPYTHAAVYFGGKAHAFRELPPAWESDANTLAPAPVPAPAAGRPAKKIKAPKPPPSTGPGEPSTTSAPSKPKRSGTKNAGPIVV
jgi:hypothetical protein